jgi:hypothetical protein
MRKLFLFPLLGLAFSLLPSTPQPIQPLQVKSCPTDATLHAVGNACQFDNPTQHGNLIVVVAGNGSAGTPYPTFCSFVSDSQKNAWTCANDVSYWNGIPIWYSLNTTGETRDTIYFDPRIGDVPIIAEYPPATEFQGMGYGTYDTQNTEDRTGECSQGQDCYLSWTLPIETEEPCELLLSWGTMGGNGLNLSAGFNSTMRATSGGIFYLEDQTTGAPGLYFGTAKWQYGNHWLMQSAAFKMGGCK